MADMSVYDGILSPGGGIYQPGPEVVMPSSGGLTSRPVQTIAVDANNWDNPFKAAEMALEARGDATGKAGAQARVAAALGFTPSANGTLVAGKDQSRMTPNQFGYGENGVTGSEVVAALKAIDAAAPKSKYDSLSFTGSDPFSAYVRPYAAQARPAAQKVAAVNNGIFGIPMSAGMSRNIAGKTGVSMIPGTNRTAAALSAVRAAARPAPVIPAAPSVSPVLSNGVANPAYRDYTPTYTSEGGGQMPAASYGGNSGGTFTDSSGGTYYSRNL